METIQDYMPATDDENAKRLEQLKKIMPDLFTSEGRLDEQALKKLVNPNVSETEHFDFRWFGKSHAKREAFTPTTATLKYDEKRSVNPDTSENIIIEGENLQVLKLLKQGYRGKIKCIYIDPPYNTGNDFVYSDKWKTGKKEYFEEVGYTENGVKLDSNPQSSGRHHSDWLSMMYSRLLASRDLLRDDGVIFISIDDNEVHHLRKLCDEVFGEENFVAELKIQVRYENKSLNEKKDFQEVQESVFLYGKNSYLTKFNRPIENYSLDNFNLEIIHKDTPSKTICENGRKVDIWFREDYSIQRVENPSENYFKETWLSGSIYSNTGHGTMYKKIIESRIIEDGYSCLYRIYGVGEDGLGYRYFTNPKEKKYNRGKMYTKIPLEKLEDIKKGKSVLKESPIISYSDFSSDFGNIRHEGGVSFNSGKKPVKMLKQFINYVKNNSDDIILDFFAGSGTTAHAVMQLNAEDGGNRKFIMVQIPETIGEKEEAYKAGFKTISDITIERNKRVIEKITKEKQEKNEEIPQGLGFKVFKLIKSNFPRVEFAPNPDATDEENIAALKRYIAEKETSTMFNKTYKDSIATEIAIKNGMSLNHTITPHTDISENDVLIISDETRKLHVCLDDEIKDSTIVHFKKNNTEKFICLERALDSTKKWNLHHYLKDNFKSY